MTPESTFNLLADAAQVRYPNPDRDNRGLCPAHGDQHNPGLVFRISTDTGNLIAYCHSQHCNLQSIADSIGVSTSAFFVGGGGNRFATHIPITWSEMSVLEIAKLVPFGYDFDTQVECVMRTLENSLTYAEVGLKELTKTEQHLISIIWLTPGFQPGMNWYEIEHKFWRAMHQLNRDTRTNTATPSAAIPRG